MNREIRVDIHLQFTAKALARIRVKHGPTEFKFKNQAIGLYPQRNDLVEIAGVDVMFVVLGRSSLELANSIASFGFWLVGCKRRSECSA
jgi:hypothetical protein